MNKFYTYGIAASILLLTITLRAAGKDAGEKKLEFIENKGQVTDQYYKPRTDIDAKLECGSGLTVFVGDGQLHYQWMREKSGGKDENAKDGKQKLPTEYDTYRMDVELADANKNAEVVMEDLQPYFENYYLPQFTDGAVAHSYSRITYKNVYPNIDWVLFTKDGSVKHEFIVRPGGDAAKIKLRYAGATSLKLEANGAFTAVTPYGVITEDAPYTYNARTKSPIASSYSLKGNVLTYSIAANEQDATFVIDPHLAWATYYGGSTGDWFTEIATDAAGNIYATGETMSSNNIAMTPGAFQGTYAGGNRDVFIVKFNRDGVRQWATYYGGSGQESLPVIAADAAGNNYMFCTAGSSGLATPGSFQPTYSGVGDGLFVKFNSSGTRQWATYYATSGASKPCRIALNNSGSMLYITGLLGGSNLSTPGAHGTNPAIGYSILASFTTSNGYRQWATYVNTFTTYIAVDPQDNIYVAGEGYLGTNISTPGAHQTVPAGGPLSGYSESCLIKYNPTTGYPIWGTYFGGPGNDDLFALHCDGLGNIYIGGYTTSTSGIATTGAFMSLGNGFLNKFNSAGVRQWGTCYYDAINAITSDSNGVVYVTGNTWYGGLATPGAYHTSPGGWADDFFASFTPANGMPTYATYYGGPYSEGGGIGNDIAYANGRISFSGTTPSLSGIATTGPLVHQTSLGGNDDGYLTQWDSDTSVYISNWQNYSGL